MELDTFLSYATELYELAVLSLEYWPVTLVFLMIFTMSKTWEYYLAIMMLKSEEKKLSLKNKEFSKSQKFFAYPMLFRGMAWDVFLNFFVGTVVFLELPRYDKKEFLFTGRVSRWNDDNGLRGKIARWFCKEFLDPFDKGGHCS